MRETLIVGEEEDPTTRLGLKLSIEVMAGMVPGTPMDEHTRRWHFTRSGYEKNDGQDYSDAVGAASYYALTLQNPQRLNWVRMDWVWY